MFKATFPYAETSEEDDERKYVKSIETTSTDETAGNVWIPPQSALKLAEEYQISPWIKALLDNTPIEVNPTKDGSPKPISSPPTFFLYPQETLAAPTPSRGRPRRSASPSKIASPKKNGAASTRSRKTKKEGSAEPSAKLASKNLQKALNAAEEEAEKTIEVESIAEETTDEVKEEIKEEPVVRVHVDTDVEVNGDVETTHTHVEVEMPAGSAELPLPEDTAAMIAKAKEMVEAAVKSQEDNGEAVVSGDLPKRSKRKAEEVEDEENEEATMEVAPAPKRAKVESELKKERVKTRALIGISATLVVG